MSGEPTLANVIFDPITLGIVLAWVGLFLLYFLRGAWQSLRRRGEKER